jgi:ribA/ribD-fused uncharacterized protein
MPSENQTRTYKKFEAAVFRTTTGEFGALSNMAPDYPVVVNGVRIPTIEALYQACRYPDFPEIQTVILDQMSPMTAKMKSKKYLAKTRGDWDGVRVSIMRWCLRTKLAQNWNKFGSVLRKTADKPIVEESTKDEFWGAKPKNDGTLVGMNVLGRLLMELRQEYREVESGQRNSIEFPKVSHFILLGRPLLESNLNLHRLHEAQSAMFERRDTDGY